MKNWGTGLWIKLKLGLLWKGFGLGVRKGHVVLTSLLWYQEKFLENTKYNVYVLKYEWKNILMRYIEVENSSIIKL